MSKRGVLTSVQNAARLLKEFTGREPELGVTELAERLDLGKSTVHRLLTTLSAEELIEQNPETGRYRLGLAIHELGGVAAGSKLHAAVLIPMTELRNRTGETVQVGVLDWRQVVYVERLDSPHTLRLFVEVGRRNDAHSTGTGKCLLAFLPPEELDRILTGWQMPAHTDQTVTSARELRQQLKEVRTRGYARNAHESELGVISVAAPIRDASNRVIAAMSVAGPAQRMESIEERLAHAVVEAGAASSRRLGWRN